MNLWNKFETHMINEGATKLRLKKLSTMFNIVNRELNLENAGREEVEAYVTNLNKNKIKRVDGKSFSGSTKSDIKKFLRQFYKWYRGNNEFYPKEVSWIKTKIPKDDRPEEKPVINVKDVMRLANTFKKPEYRIITLLLFDSGYRIQEMLSVKKKDLAWEKGEDSCFWINCNESKTEKRKIPIPLFTEDIKNFVNSSYFLTLNDDDFIFNFDYSRYRLALRKNSLKLLNKVITPHALRHSSATYYAKEYDGHMNLIAERYGWSFSSKQLATYIRRSGAYQRMGAKKTFVNKYSELEKEFAEYKEETGELLDRTRRELANMKRMLNSMRGK